MNILPQGHDRNRRVHAVGPSRHAFLALRHRFPGTFWQSRSSRETSFGQTLGLARKCEVIFERTLRVLSRNNDVFSVDVAPLFLKSVSKRGYGDDGDRGIVNIMKVHEKRLKAWYEKSSPYLQNPHIPFSYTLVLVSAMPI